jgi:hypothetical protein
MDTQGVCSLGQVVARPCARSTRRAAARAAGIVAIAAALCLSLHRPAAAQSGDRVPPGFFPIETPLYLDFRALEVVHETRTRVGHDEPYVVMVGIDLRGPEPQVIVRRTRIYGQMDDGSIRFETVRLWGAAPIANPDDVIFLVQAMEHDRRTSVDRLLGPDGANLVRSLRFSLGRLLAEGASPDAIVERMRDGLHGFFWTRAFFEVTGRDVWDDRIGPAQEVDLTAEDLARARSGTNVVKRIDHRGNHAHYRTYFILHHGVVTARPR